MYLYVIYYIVTVCALVVGLMNNFYFWVYMCVSWYCFNSSDCNCCSNKFKKFTCGVFTLNIFWCV